MEQVNLELQSPKIVGDETAVKPYVQVLDVAPESEIDTFQLQQTPSPQKGKPEVQPTSCDDPSAEKNNTVAAENSTAAPPPATAPPASPKKDKPSNSPKKDKPSNSPKKYKPSNSPKKAKPISSPKGKKKSPTKRRRSSAKKELSEARKTEDHLEKDKKRRRRRSLEDTVSSDINSKQDKRTRNNKRMKEDPGKDVKGILKKRDTPPKCNVTIVNGTPQGEKNPRSLEDLIESPALFDREYIRKATKDELLIACGPTGLLPKKHSERTCKNMRTALEQTREDIIKNIELDKPVLLLKNMGKHTFYRVSVIEVTSPGGGQVDEEKQFELRCEWGATGMKKPSKFESDTSLKLQAPKTQTQSKFFASKEEAEAEARKIIKSKDQKRGYYVSMADNLAGVDEHKQVEVSQRKINFAKKAIVQPFYGSEKPKKATKLKTSTAPAKK